jgi:hypothetical protein
LKIKEKPTSVQLENSELFGTMCTHRARLASLQEVDSELISRIKKHPTFSFEIN